MSKETRHNKLKITVELDYSDLANRQYTIINNTTRQHSQGFIEYRNDAIGAVVDQFVSWFNDFTKQVPLNDI